MRGGWCNDVKQLDPGLGDHTLRFVEGRRAGRLRLLQIAVRDADETSSAVGALERRLALSRLREDAHAGSLRRAQTELSEARRATAEVQVEVRPLREVTRECEVEHIKVALEATGGHRSQTAELLGISRKVLWEKLRDFGIDPDDAAGERGDDA